MVQDPLFGEVFLPRDAEAKGAWGSGFCERCEAALPDPLALHLRRAISDRWFMRWWRFAMRLQRTANEKLESH